MNARKLLNLVPWVLLIIVSLAFAMYTWTDLGRNMVSDFIDERVPRVEAAPIALMPPFWSYSDIDKIMQLLQSRNLEFNTDVTTIPKFKNRPAKRLQTLYIEHYTDQGVPGELTLEFINGRLYEVEFNPYVADPYENIVRNKMGMIPDPRKNGRSVRIRGMQRVSTNIFLATSRVGRSLRTKPYVIWQDLRLVSQL